jgi:hypothetical protein
MNEETEVAKLTEFETNLVNAAQSCEIARQEKNHTIQTLKLAKGLSDLKRALLAPEVLSLIKELMNTPTGFLTDKDPSKPVKNKKTQQWENPTPYSDKIIVECVADAMSKGLTIHNNEFNIIVGRMYPAQAGFTRKLAEFKRKHKIKAGYMPSIPKKSGAAYFCEAVAWWQKEGEDRQEETISWNLAAFSEDAALGKVKKRANEWLFNELSGNTWTSAENHIDFNPTKNANDIDMPEEPREQSTPPASKETVLDALNDAETIKGLEARYKKACDIGFSKDDDIHAAYNEKRESFQ